MYMAFRTNIEKSEISIALTLHGDKWQSFAETICALDMTSMISLYLNERKENTKCWRNRQYGSQIS